MAVEQYPDVDRTILAVVYVGGDGKAEFVAHAGGGNAHRAERRQSVALKQHRIQQGNIHMLAFPGLIPVAERRHRPDRRVQTAEVVRQKDTGLVGAHPAGH